MALVSTATDPVQGMAAVLLRAPSGIVRRSLLAAPHQKHPVSELERRIQSFLNPHFHTDLKAEFNQEISLTFFLLRY